MKPLPLWMDNGVVIGMQGGTIPVRDAAELAKVYGYLFRLFGYKIGSVKENIIWFSVMVELDTE